MSFFLPGLEGKKNKKEVLQCLDDSTQSVQSHMIIIPSTVWKLQIAFIFARIPDGTTNIFYTSHRLLDSSQAADCTSREEDFHSYW